MCKVVCNFVWFAFIEQFLPTYFSQRTVPLSWHVIHGGGGVAVNQHITAPSEQLRYGQGPRLVRSLVIMSLFMS